MHIDISQFHQTFLAEAGEHLDELERGLLALEKGDAYDLNAIFRAAHSIKGGAATFGFLAIAELTHALEAVLELARSQTLALGSAEVSLLLEARDVLAHLLDAARRGTPAEAVPHQAECRQRLMALANLKDAAPKADTAGPTGRKTWVIQMTPKPRLLHTGSDPLLIFRELEGLGTLVVTAHTDGVPPLASLDPELLHLRWTLQLTTDAAEAAIRDAFLFVEDDAQIDIRPKATATDEVLTPDPMPDRRQHTDRRVADRRTPADARQEAFIRVSTAKVDHLINLVGELVTTNAMVLQHANGLDAERNTPLVTTMNDLARHTRAMQEAIMAIRMMPMSFVFSRFPRMVRDTATKLGKQVELVTDGDHTELDKTVIERLADPLTHLVRNAIDHGIEMPEARRQAGKNPVAQVRLSAYHKGGNVFIDVADDGAGLNHKRILAKAIERGLVAADTPLTDDDIAALIFQPGFSTADVVTDVSGRGVGMDVVRRNIHELGGSVGISTQPGQGTVFTIRLPLTLAIVDGMAIRLDDQVYIIPILNIIESLRPSPGQVKTIGRDTEVLTVRGDYLPLIRLADIFGVPAASAHRDDATGIAMIVEAEQQRAALFVDDLIGERQVVIKSLEENYRPVEGVSGATILGDGRVALILDLPGLVKRAHRVSTRGAFIKEDDHDHRAYADAQ